MVSYNRYGLRWITEKEINARKKFVLTYAFSKKEKFHKPLNSYQDDKKSLSLPELVRARHEDEMKRLKERYQDFFEFTESSEYRSYQQQKQKMQQDYQDQKQWVGFYQNDHNFSAHMAQLAALRFTTGLLLFSAGTFSAASRTPLYPATTSLFYIGALANFYTAYQNIRSLRNIPRNKEYIQMVLEDWHEPDRFARYDRAILNDALQQLDQQKPSQTRLNKKRELVKIYRSKHPKAKDFD